MRLPLLAFVLLFSEVLLLFEQKVIWKKNYQEFTKIRLSHKWLLLPKPFITCICKVSNMSISVCVLHHRCPWQQRHWHQQWRWVNIPSWTTHSGITEILPLNRNLPAVCCPSSISCFPATHSWVLLSMYLPTFRKCHGIHQCSDYVLDALSAHPHPVQSWHQKGLVSYILTINPLSSSHKLGRAERLFWINGRFSKDEGQQIAWLS